MKKLAVILGLLAIAAFPAFAATDNYHYNSTMKCSDCHSMHASSHDNLPVVVGDGAAITDPNAANKGSFYFPAATAPQHYLLKGTDVCASCHKDQTFAPDVFGDNENGYVRSAGGVKEVGETTGGGHVIGTTTRPPGYSAAGVNNYFSTGALECYSCHSPHGGSNYRNLVPYQMRSALGANASMVGVTVAKAAAFDSTKDVTIIGGNTYNFGGTLSDYYGRNKIVYGNNVVAGPFNGTTSSNRMDQFCGVCHGAFHGGSDADTTTVGGGAGTGFVRHPTSTVVIGSLPTSNLAASTQAFANLKVYQAAGTAAAATDSPGCLTCHKAHGNNNPFALIYPGFTAADTTEEGAGVYKSLCKTCHSMGGSDFDMTAGN